MDKTRAMIAAHEISRGKPVLFKKLGFKTRTDTYLHLWDHRVRIMVTTAGGTFLFTAFIDVRKTPSSIWASVLKDALAYAEAKER